MKKLLMVLSVLFLMSGCGENNDTLSCRTTTTTNGITTKTSYDVEYLDEDIKYVTITYDYSQDNTTNNDTNTNARNGNGTMDNNNTNNGNATTNDANGNTDTANNNNNTRNGNNNNDNDNDVDGLNADTDGLDEDKNDNNTALESDDVVDGIVGDVIDGAINGVTETILDIAGIKNRYETQLSAYDNIEGLSYTVDTDNNNEYKIIYKIDMDKISDSDLARFNIDRNFTNFRDNYQGLGYTCK